MFDTTELDDLGDADWRPGLLDQLDPPEPGYSCAQVAPSGWLALELDVATADPAVLGDAGLVDAVIAFDRVSSWALARQARLLAEFTRRRPGDAREAAGSDRTSMISRWAPDEIGLALGLSRLTAKARLAQATQLVTVLCGALGLWEAGRIDLPKVRAIGDAVAFLDPDQARRVQDRVRGWAPEQTLGQLRASLARAVAAVDRDGAARRHQEAKKGRRVVLGGENEGMASLWALLSAPDALSAYHWLTRLARGLGKDDPRGMDARRADLLHDLIMGQLTITHTDDADDPGADEPNEAGTGRAGTTEAGTGEAGTGESWSDQPELGVTEPGSEVALRAGRAGMAGAGHGERAECGRSSGRVVRAADGGPARRGVAPAAPAKPLIHIVMPHTALTGADDHPAELVGYGPIPAEVAREIAADAVWRRLTTDPLSGALLDCGRTTYRPPQALADFVRARDVECRGPICRRRALDSELDHNLAWADGGPTSGRNLWAGCLHDHHLKHAAGWTVTLHPDATMTWTAPTGHSYTSEPHDYRPEPLEPRHQSPPALPPPPRLGVRELLDGAPAPPDNGAAPPF